MDAGILDSITDFWHTIDGDLRAFILQLAARTLAADYSYGLEVSQHRSDNSSSDDDTASEEDELADDDIPALIYGVNFANN